MKTRQRAQKGIAKRIPIPTGYLFVGANIDLDSPHSKKAQWDVVLSSCVLSLVGKLPARIYSGIDYNVPWKRVKARVSRFKRYNDISGVNIKKLIYEKKFDKVRTLVPHEVFKMIKKRF